MSESVREALERLMGAAEPIAEIDMASYRIEPAGVSWHELNDALEYARAALAAEPPRPSLDAAWARAEAAVPEDRVLRLEQRPDLGPDDQYEAWCGPRAVAIAAIGPTAAAALLALAAKLREREA